MVLEKLKALLAAQFDVEESSITAETNIVDDLGADSLDVVELIMTLEGEFDVHVPEEEVEGLRTVGEVAQFVESLL